MGKRPSIRRYHELTLALVIGLSFSIGLSSAVFPAWAGLTFLLLSAALRAQKQNLRFYRAMAVFVTVASFMCSLFIAFTTYRETQDIVFFFGPIFSSCVSLALMFHVPHGLDWKISASTMMLAITSVIGGGEVVDHFFFILFCAAFVFYLNATYFIEREPTEQLPEGYFRPFVICLFAGWSFGIFIFVFFPRTIQWSNPFGLRDRQVLTGYSGALSLNGSGPTPSSSLALVVEPLDATVRTWLTLNGPDLYFRGNALDQFDGLKWNQTLLAATPLKLHRPRKPTGIVYGIKIYREPHSNPWIVYPGSLWNLDIPYATTGRPLIDEAGNVLRSITGYLRYSYTIDFEETPLFTYEMNPELTSREFELYTGVPPSIAEATYFKVWLENFSSTKKAEPLIERLAAVSKYFQSNYKAVLAKNSLSLEKFLTADKEGHCEYFATVTALSLRSWGFPARVVLGYRGGQFNRHSQVLEVRDENAHAWVEVFLPKRGWLRYDPTPLVRRQPRFAWMQEMELWTGAAKYWFSRYVVDYNSKTQTELILNFGKNGLFGFKKRAMPKTRHLLLALVGGLLIVFAASLKWRRRQSARQNAIPPYYRDFKRKLRRFGFIRRPNETYRLFHSRIVHREISQQTLSDIDRRLEKDLYAA